MEEKVMEVLRRMQEILEETQLRELKNVLDMVFTGCSLVEETGVRVVDRSWADELEDFLMSKALEGKSAETVKRYRYELYRLLSYIDKGVADIVAGDISAYMQAYKRIRKISNQTLKNVRAVYSSFFAWLRDRDRIRRKPYTDEERERMLRECETLRDKAMLEFMYSTAVRVSELVALNREDIRFGTKDLVVFGKGAKERTVYLNDRTNMYMREYLQSRTDDNPALFVWERKPHKRISKAGI